MTVRTSEHRVQVVTLGLPAGRAVRVDLERLPDGTPDVLRLTVGWPDPWRPERGHLLLPGAIVGELAAALATLADGGL